MSNRLRAPNSPSTGMAGWDAKANKITRSNGARGLTMLLKSFGRHSCLATAHANFFSFNGYAQENLPIQLEIL